MSSQSTASAPDTSKRADKRQFGVKAYNRGAWPESLWVHKTPVFRRPAAKPLDSLKSEASNMQWAGDSD
jgi:hypothetical protein